MQIILSDKECEIIHEALVSKGVMILLGMSSEKDEDFKEERGISLEEVNEVISRFEPYIEESP